MAGEVPVRTVGLEREVEVGHRTVGGSAVPVPGLVVRGFGHSMKSLRKCWRCRTEWALGTVHMVVYDGLAGGGDLVRSKSGGG